MEGKYQAYPEYKDSEIAGLGNTPSHWTIMQLKRTVDGCTNGIWGAEPKNDGEDTIVLRVADFDRSRLDIKNDGYTIRSIHEKDKLNRKLRVGDLLLEKSGGGEKTLVGQVVLFNKSFEAVTSNFVAKMTPVSGFNSRFLNYVFSRFYSDNINFCSIKQNTGIQNLDSSAYLSEKFGFPPEYEQQKIANFLDHETAKIDTLIEKQQQLIKLLKEKRQAVISHAVTKGLNPDAPMRDSGVEWLGEVPEHWEVCRVKQASSFITSGPRGWSDYLSDSGTNIFLQSGDLNYKLGLELADAKKVSPPNNAEGVRTKLGGGDVVVCITGANTGRVAITPPLLNDTVYINQHLSLIRPIKALFNSEYLGFVLSSSSVKSYFSVTQYGLKEGLSLSNVGEAPTCLPPMKEQQEIVLYLKNLNNKFDTLEVSGEKQIGLLHERRSALISAAVTGKIDVRNWQSPKSASNEAEEASL